VLDDLSQRRRFLNFGFDRIVSTDKENTARSLIAIGSLGSAGAVLALLSQWHWAP